MNESLFRDFPPVSLSEWEEKIIKDLKGKSIEDVSRNTLDGIIIRPHYSRENVPHNEGIPGVSPYLRGLQTKPSSWEIVEIVEGSDPQKLNKEVLSALNNGANALYLNGLNPENLPHLLKDVDFRYISTYFDGSNPKETIKSFEQIAQNVDRDTTEVTGSYGFDPLGNALITGKNPDTDWLYPLIAEHHKTLPRFGFIDVRGAHYHNAGASQAQEIAFSLAQAHQYLTEACSAGIPLDEATARIQFTLAAGSEYLVEIAKFRALRSLWAYIVDRYNPEYECSSATHINAETSSRFAAVYDEHNNMVRSTIQCMAAAMGGADSITVLPFNHAYAEATPFSRRMARNTNLILQEESHFDKVLDPAGGSYVIDQLTNELSHKAWELFQKTENKGGFTECLNNEFIQNTVLQTAEQQEEMFRNGELVLVGVNKFADEQQKVRDKMKAEKKPETAENPDFKPLPPSRIAEDFERKRMNKEA